MDAFDSVLAAARAGADWAWERIYADLAGSVIGYLRVHGAPDPEDVAGEVFLQVVRDLPRFSGDERDFRAWVFTIVHRRLLDSRRARSRRPAGAPLEAVPEARGGDVADDAHARLDRARVLELLADLPPDQRSVLLLRILGDMTIDEIARAVGKRPGAVKALQRRGLKRVAKAYPSAGPER
ncbi:MAG TPA: sigma-70 family RNA polymerase sigma factor [Solirubrobacteraceae bacterium]|nr:sigma-70 family RNA polymerase sigma factor [Solirubrobacteraceae bacterium]